MKNCILIHYHEIATKGGNRDWFENTFTQNVRRHIEHLPFSKVIHRGARVYIFKIDYQRWAEYAAALRAVMGLANATLMLNVAPDAEAMKAAAEVLVKDREFETYRISARRQDKTFPMKSMEINILLGDHVGLLTGKAVRLKGADLDLKVEIVPGEAYLGVDRIYGFGGLPVGVSEKAVVLLSSGIDSPVAAFEMLKRGVELVYIHFHSAPATSRQSIRNVEALCQILARYQLSCPVYTVPILELQQSIMASAPNKYWVLLFRRVMVRLADRLAQQVNGTVLISGESVGQVASQTLSNITAVAAASSRPILRPLAGHNKEDIVNRAREIGTYETSVEPYQDCCSFFVPPHPETKARLEDVTSIESNLQLDDLYDNAMAQAELRTITYDPQQEISRKIQHKAPKPDRLKL